MRHDSRADGASSRRPLSVIDPETGDWLSGLRVVIFIGGKNTVLDPCPDDLARLLLLLFGSMADDDLPSSAVGCARGVAEAVPVRKACIDLGEDCIEQMVTEPVPCIRWGPRLHGLHLIPVWI